MEQMQEENSVDSEEEERKYDYGLYLLKRLVQIKRSEQHKKRLDMLLRAFYRWSFEFPLAQKCDELAKQLRERSLMMDTVRSSYLRDVVSIKYQLDKINDAEVDGEDVSLVKLKQNMYDLHTLPSVDLRSLVENVRQSVRQTSAQLRESLVDAGLLDPETLRTLNPWDQSRGYRRIMRIKKGGAYKPPDIEGESITLAAPTSKKLYVRYCKDCVGMTVFIKAWNKEVEDSLKFKADFANVDEHIQGFRILIGKLNDTIAGQERKIVDLMDYTSKLETANAWFEKWGASKAGAAGANRGGGGLDIEADSRFKHMSEMAKAELESFAFNSSMRVDAKHQVFVEAEKILLEKLHIAELNKVADSKEKMEILREFRKAQKELSVQKNEMKHLQMLADTKEEEKAVLQGKLSSVEEENTKLHEIVDRKEIEYATLRNDTNAKMEDLNFQIKTLNNDYNSRESTIDDLRDAVQSKTMELRDKSSELQDLRERIHDLELLIPPPKPRFTLRVAAIAVRYLIRLNRMLAKKDFTALGKIGFQEVIRRQDKFIKMLNNANEKQNNRLRVLEESYGFQACEVESYRAILQEKNSQLKDHARLKQLLKYTEARLKDVQREKDDLVALNESSYEAQNVIINARIGGALEVQHTHHLQQAKIYAQIQRNIGHHLAQSIFRVRSVITSLDIDANLAILAKPYESNMLTALAPNESMRLAPQASVPMLLQPSSKQLKAAMKARSIQLVSWIKRNRLRASLLPKRVPVVLFKQTPSREDMSGDDREALQRDKKKSLSVMTHVIQHDFEHVEAVRKQAVEDIRKVQDYVLALKNKHNDLIQTIKDLEEELREERMPSQTSQVPRKRIGDIKASYAHLMRSLDPNHQNSYFSNVLQAIDMVQQEHGEIFKEKLIKSGKFKLTEMVKAVVRRNSLKGIDLFPGADANVLTNAHPPPTRIPSGICVSTKLPSLTENEPELVPADMIPAELLAEGAEGPELAVEEKKVAVWELSSKYSPRRKNRGFLDSPLKKEVSFFGLNAGSSKVDVKPIDMMQLQQEGSAPSAPTSERSFGYTGGDLSNKPTSPSPHRATQQGRDTVGFESDSDEEGDNLVLPGAEELDEDIIYMEDLLAAKDEMVGLLTREEEIQSIIKQAEVDKLNLADQVKALANRLEQKELEFSQLRMQSVSTSGELQQLQKEYDALAHQNELLREIVEEDYRYHTATMERAVRDTEEREKMKSQYVKPDTSNISTQVSCAVCAIREEGLQFKAHPAPSSGYDDSTIAMVKDSFTRALNGEVVLIAQPRRINSKKAAAAAAARANQELPPRGPPMAAFEELRGSLVSGKQAPGSYLEADAEPRFDSTNAGFSQLLMRHLDSNPYGVQSNHHSNPSSNNNNNHNNQHSPNGKSKPHSANGARSSSANLSNNNNNNSETSKFSRLKKMPFKGSASNSELLGNGSHIGKIGIPPRPQSAHVATLKKGLDGRTESHTAAYLQSQLMVGYGSGPQAAPTHTESPVPLHTVGLASGRPESTAAYLAQATAQNRQRASSASAARIEHTNSSSLLPAADQQYLLDANGGGSGSQRSHSSSAHSNPHHNQSGSTKLQLEVRLNAVMKHADPGGRDYIADITDEMSDGGFDEFV